MIRIDRSNTVLLRFIISEMFLLSACNQIMSPTHEITALPAEGNNAQMTPALSTPVESNLQLLINKATTNLAQRLTISENEIVVLEATSVTWPDGSLGCPQEGMVYAQVLTPGYLIRLQSGEQEFEYHASRSTTVIFCENPAPPIPGTPADI
jgi:hypothetical protein